MSEIVIQVNNLSKAFHSYSRVRYRIMDMFYTAFQSRKSLYGKEFWALKDISFSLKKGESLGIMGRNGAGKSTLLQILAGTLTPTNGTVEVKGRVNALLELGSGFNPEFSGRENVYMNGTILGFTKKEIDTKFQAIWEFSEIGNYIDEPVKTYSSGMFVRLAFAVQAMLEPEVLIVDEALSVGDAIFQQKCHAKIEELLKKGNTTFLFVSHDTYSVRKHCQKAIVLEKGRIKYEGNTTDAINIYHDGNSFRETSTSQLDSESSWKVSRPDDDLFQLEFLSAKIWNEKQKECLEFFVSDFVYVYYKVKFKNKGYLPYFGIEISNSYNILMYSKNSIQAGIEIQKSDSDELIFEVLEKVKLDLFPGKYILKIGVNFLESIYYENLHSYSLDYLHSISQYSYRLSGLPLIYVETKRPMGDHDFFGMANLDSEFVYIKKA
jgi:lipopolysaccharide transport system ATP-binding protein